jgi:ABC-type multidrug transport system ATPase subunit
VAAGARLRDSGVTIILTTHYIEEAEEMADRIGVINKGELILVEDKAELMRKLGKKQLTLQLQRAARRRARSLAAYALELLAADGASCLHLRRPGRAHRHHRAAAATWPRPASLQGPADHRRARWRTSSSAW